jgi:hypothetical protein
VRNNGPPSWQSRRNKWESMVNESCHESSTSPAV